MRWLITHSDEPDGRMRLTHDVLKRAVVVDPEESERLRQAIREIEHQWTQGMGSRKLYRDVHANIDALLMPFFEEKDDCYHDVKKRYKRFPSARASQAIAKCRKAKGEVRKSPRGLALRRWARERWVDTRTGKPCGAGGDLEYCRPSRRVAASTPVTIGELEPEEIEKKQAEKKRVGMGKRVSALKDESRWSRSPLLSEVIASSDDLISFWKRPEAKPEPEPEATKAPEAPEPAKPGDELPPPIPSPERAEVKDRNYGLKKVKREPRKPDDAEAKAERLFKARQDRLSSLQSIAKTSLDIGGTATSRGLGSSYHRYK